MPTSSEARRRREDRERSYGPEYGSSRRTPEKNRNRREAERYSADRRARDSRSTDRREAERRSAERREIERRTVRRQNQARRGSVQSGAERPALPTQQMTLYRETRPPAVRYSGGGYTGRGAGYGYTGRAYTGRKRRRPGRRLKRRGFLPLLLCAVLVLAAGGFAASRFLIREPEQKTELLHDPTVISQPAVPFTSVTVVRENPKEEDDTPETVLEMPVLEETPRARKPHFFTFLLAGVDDNNGGSDTMILVAMDTENKRITGVSLPRDTKAYVNGSACKLNFAYRTGGMERLASTVSWQLGIPVDYTVEVDLNGFAALVDAIGGVDFDVPINMDYDDPSQNLYIGFEAGMQHLDGKDALKVVRFRHNWDGTGYGDEDFGRMRTQQNFLKTVAKKMLRPANITKLGKFAEIFQEYVKTDLTVSNLAWLGGKAIDAGADGVEFSTLPSSWKYPYVYLDKNKVLEIINEKFNPYEEPLTSQDLHVAT